MTASTAKKKIVLTGAPSSGKSTTMARLAKEVSNNMVMVPESAMILLAGGFPAPSHDDLEQIRAFQQAIIQVQTSVEFVFTQQNLKADTMVFDRGALDGAGFWPPGIQDFINYFQMDVKQEFARYDYVLFLELPNKQAFGGINNLRFHNYEQSLASEKKLKEIWHTHPHFIEIEATEIFENKILAALAAIKKIALC